MIYCMQGRHAFIIFEGARLGGGGGLVTRHVTHSNHNSIYVLFNFFLLFIWNIPKRINYIMKYLDSHLYRSIVGDGQSNLIM